MIVGETVYMDYQATTPIDPRVYDLVQPYFKKDFGNPHSLDHSFGWKANKALENSRTHLASALSIDSNEIYFTSGATEANNLALKGLLPPASSKRNKLIVSSIEHKSILSIARYVRELGFNLSVVPVDSEGVVDLSRLEELLDETVFLVSIMAVNNEIGSIQPLQQIAQMSHLAGALFHSDCAQAFGAIDLSLDDIDLDLASFSAHKIYGPKGIGALYVKKGLEARIVPIIHGGGQEGGLRSGTQPTALCLGFGEAIRIMKQEGEAERSHIKTLRKHFYKCLSNHYPSIQLNGPPLEKRHAGNLNICFPGQDAKDILNRLQPLLAASTGSACTSGIPEPSHVLKAIGLTGEEAESSIRFSLGRFSTLEQVEQAANLIREKLISGTTF